MRTNVYYWLAYTYNKLVYEFFTSSIPLSYPILFLGNVLNGLLFFVIQSYCSSVFRVLADILLCILSFYPTQNIIYIYKRFPNLLHPFLKYNTNFHVKYKNKGYRCPNSICHVWLFCLYYRNFLVWWVWWFFML